MTISITWWGHATATIEIGGLRVLTDPVLTHRLAHLRRIGGPIPAPSAALADIVLISHLHADHLHIPSLRVMGTATSATALAAAVQACVENETDIDEVGGELA